VPFGRRERRLGARNAERRVDRARELTDGPFSVDQVGARMVAVDPRERSRGGAPAGRERRDQQSRLPSFVTVSCIA
jgi:hypothetical protein